MPTFNITIDKGGLVRQGLENLADTYPKVGRLQLYRTVLSVYRRLGIYPKKLPGQVYKRTYASRRARFVERLDDGYRIVYDPIDSRGKPYGVYLRGTPTDASRQARYHQGRWTPQAVILDEELAKLPAEVVELLRVEAAKAVQETHRRG